VLISIMPRLERRRGRPWCATLAGVLGPRVSDDGHLGDAGPFCDGVVPKTVV
jgi:hypothetical protein